jgi:hypothetical protein
LTLLTIFLICFGTFVAMNGKIKDSSKTACFVALGVILVIGGLLGWLMG